MSNAPDIPFLVNKVGDGQQRGKSKFNISSQKNTKMFKPCHLPISGFQSETSNDWQFVHVPVEAVHQLQPLMIHDMEVGLPTLLAAAWALALRVYTGTNSVCFGFWNGDNIQDRITTSFFGIDITENDLVTAFLSKTKHLLVESYKGDESSTDIPFDTELFNSGILLQHTLKEYTASILSVGKQDVLVQARSLHGGIEINICYRPARIAQTMAENIAHTLGKILSEIHSNFWKAVGVLDILSERDHEQIWRWNHTLPIAANRCVHDIITIHAQNRPDAPAICSWEGEVTYGELDILSTKLASRLAKLGVCHNVIVPIFMEKAIWVVVAAVGVMKAGGAFTLMDVNQPDSRLRGIVQEVGATVLIVSVDQASRAVHLAGNAITLSVSRQMFEWQPDALPLVSQPISTAPLYVVFTSGSTGKPKGVIITHSNYISGALQRGKVIGYNENCRVLDLPSYSFDMSLECILGTLVTGGCVCEPSEFERLNDVTGAIKAMKVNALHTTPTVARLLDSESLCLEWIRLGGESLDAVDLDWADRARLYPGYGPSECAVVSTLNAASPVGIFSGHTNLDRKHINPKSIGRGVATVTWVVDAADHERLVPIGAVGELVIEGPTVGQGYLNDIAKTAAAFPNPPSWLLKNAKIRARDCGRLYKTGDLVRYEADGSLTFIGRRDGQVKIRGQRLELGEIEYHLRQVLPAKTILAVEMIDSQDGSEDHILAAFVALTQQTKSYDQSDLDVFLANEEDQRELLDLVDENQYEFHERLPRYMIPSVYIALQQMPLTSSGKTDRKQLREYGSHISVKQFMSLRERDRVIVQPENAKEEVLLKSWATVLKMEVSEISTADSFSSLGGDSIAAMKVAAQARLKGFLLSVESIFGNPVLSKMAQNMSDAAKVVADDTAAFSLIEDIKAAKLASAKELKIPVEKIQDIFPCTPLQEGLMALSSKRRGEYITKNVVDFSSEKVELPRFKAAWQTVYKNNSVLRTRIIHLEGHGLVHVVLDENLDWSSGTNVDSDDQQTDFGLNTPLTRLAIIPNKSMFRFIWTVHHAIMDGWAKQLVLDQVSQAYRGLASGPRPQFSSFISYLHSLEWEAMKNFWRSELSDAQCIPFPSLPSPNYQPLASQTMRRHISIERASLSHITRTTLIKAAWSIVIAMQTKCDEAIFGTIVTGRGAPVRNIMQMVGPTLATVPVRICLHKDELVQQFLQRVQQQSFSTIPFEQYGLQNIQKLGPEQEALCRFQTLIVVQPQIEQRSETDNGIINLFENYNAMHEFSTYAVQMEFTPVSNGYSLSVVFDPEVVHPKQITRLIDQFQYTLKQLCRANTAQKLIDINTVSEKESKEIWKWNKNIAPAVCKPIHDLIMRFAYESPQSQAVDSWDGQLTYAKLESLSFQLAQHLVRLGVKAEVIVPLCFEKSMWTIVSMLAVLRAGGAFVLLDRSHPKDRLEYIIKKVKAEIMLASPIAAPLFTSSINQCIVVTAQFVASLKFDLPQPEIPNVLSTSAAVTLFTSGSTGVPKGMLQNHSTASTSAVTIAQAFGYEPTTRLLQFATYSFDMSVIDILTTLVGGGCICVPSEQDLMNNLHYTIRSMRVNTLCMTPSVARTLEPDEIPEVKRIVLGGEPIRKDLVDIWAKRVVLINGYGPAEASVCVAGVVDPQYPSVVGRAIGSATWIVDETYGHLSPIGAVGELAIEGPLLARGYLDDPTATAAKFIDNPDFLTYGPFGRNGRVYMTGDLARYNADGNIEICGRKDTQVKLRGQRVELGEVEHALRQRFSSKIDLAAEVITPEQGRGEPALVAFVAIVSKGEDAPGRETTLEYENETLRRTMLVGIEESLRKDLPKYMIPSAFIILPRMPLTVSGKEDRKQLRAIGASMSAEQLAALRAIVPQERVEPRTPTEILLQKLWASTIKIEESRIAANDNFFGLGGDSIGAMRLVAAVRANGLMLTVAEVFEYSHLSDMAQRLTNSQPNLEDEISPFSLINEDVTAEELRDSAAVLCNILPEQIQDIYPRTSLQEGLVALSVKRDGSYISRSIMELPEMVDIDRFQAAWQTVFSASPILRTRIVQLNIHPGLLQILVDEDIHWDLSNDLETYLAQDRSVAIEPGMPLGRYSIITDPVTLRKSFVWTTHHAIYDGWSKPLILSRVAQVYQGMELEHTTNYNAFIRYLGTMDRKKTEIYWQSQFETADVPIFPPMPTPSYKPQANALAVREIQIELQPGSTITTSTLIRAAWSLLVSRITGSEDVAFGATITGRNAPVLGIEGMEGPTFTTVPVRIQVKADMPVAEFLEEVQAHSTGMIPHEHFGLQNIRRLSEKAQSVCDFQTLLVLQPHDDRDTDNWLFGPDSSTGGISASSTSEFNTYAMMLVCSISTHAINAKASFDTNVISTEQMQRLLKQLDWTLQQLLPAPKDAIGTLESVDPEEIMEMWCWNKTVPKTIDTRVHDLFSVRVRENPKAPAIHSWDGGFNYMELERLSSQVATHLVLCVSIGLADIVLICFEKSKWTLVAMLGVMKAGSTFVLIDDSQPQARLQSIVEQLQPRAILASEKQASRTHELCRRIPVTILSDETVAGLKILENDQHDSMTSSHFPSSTPLYIAFTSGSTGQPKGAVISHSNYLSGVLPRAQAMGFFDRKPRVFEFASYSFDVSIENMLIAILSGGCVCIPSHERRMNDIEGVIESMEIDTMHITPSLARLLEPEKLPLLKTVRLGGEAMAAIDVSMWKSRVDLFNSYGPSECSVTCVMNFDVKANPRNIGRGIAANTWVVDSKDHTKLVPIGATGELLIEGPIVGQGYWNDESKTEAVFVENLPWLANGTQVHPGRSGRLYKTGDLVRYESNGTIVFLGRKDTQVKLHGQRIELGEIEHHLRLIFSRADVLVEIITPKEGEPRLVAFVAVARTDEKPVVDIAELQLQVDNMAIEGQIKVREALPGFMVPSAYVAIPRIPLNSSGKADRKQLRQMDLSMVGGKLKAEKKTPVTAKERALQALWATSLRIEVSSIGINDTFFEVGGDSIGAMRLVAAARAQGLSLSVADIFSHSLLSDMAFVMKAIDDYSKPNTIHSRPFSFLDVPDIPAYIDEVKNHKIQNPNWSVKDILPTTDYQDFTIERSYTKPRDQLLYDLIYLDNSIDTKRLIESCRHLVVRHEILRTVFTKGSDGWLAVVLSDNIVEIDEYQAEESVEDFAKYLCKRDADGDQIIAGSPLARFMFITHLDGSKCLILRISHAQYDGIGLHELLNALSTIYEGRSLPSPGTFSSYIHHVYQGSTSDSYSYWCTLLHGAVMARLPLKTDTRKPVSKNPSPAEISYQITRFISNVKTPPGITMGTVVTTAWALTLIRRAQPQNQDVTFGRLVSGRNIALDGAEHLAGPCINVAPVRVTLQPGQSILDLLNAVQAQGIASAPFETLKLRELVSNCTDWSNDTQFESVVQHQNVQSVNFLRFGACQARVEGHVPHTQLSRMWWLLSVPMQDGRLRIKLSGRQSMSGAAEGLIETFCCILKKLLHEPGIRKVENL